MNQTYLDTVRLLLDLAPSVFRSPRFAMKGGTALNLFVHDLPRLSVDIDVVYVDFLPDRETALAHIKADLVAAQEYLQQIGYEVRIPRRLQGDDVKMVVATEEAQVKVEVNQVFRGTLLPPVNKSLTPRTQEVFTADVRVPVLDVAELYGSKLVAAMDRQHPRDIFDVQLMFRSFGLQEAFVDCFVAYLAGHNRPVHELINAPAKPLAGLFEAGFQGMTIDAVSLESLESTQAELQSAVPRALLPRHRKFLLSMAKAEPEWDLMPFTHLQQLPAIRWKLLNLAKLRDQNTKRFAIQYDELAKVFDALA